jgi:hypothetical protein
MPREVEQRGSSSLERHRRSFERHLSILLRDGMRREAHRYWRQRNVSEMTPGVSAVQRHRSSVVDDLSVAEWDVRFDRSLVRQSVSDVRQRVYDVSARIRDLSAHKCLTRRCECHANCSKRHESCRKVTVADADATRGVANAIAPKKCQKWPNDLLASTGMEEVLRIARGRWRDESPPYDSGTGAGCSSSSICGALWRA